MKTRHTEKFLQNEKNTLINGVQLKVKNQIMTYCWTFGKDPLKWPKIYEWSTIKYDIVDYGVTMNLQKESFIEPAESCSHFLKITLWKLVPPSPEI